MSSERTCSDYSPTPRIWITQDGEPLPCDQGARLMRCGIIAEMLEKQGCRVDWFCSRFDHAHKRQRLLPQEVVILSERLHLYPLAGPGYSKNLSLRRIWHQQSVATHFRSQLKTVPKPDLILASYPSPELCFAAAKFSQQHKIPLVLDIRDAWPDIFSDYLSRPLRWAAQPLLWHYHHLLRESLASATCVLANSNRTLQWALEVAARPVSNFDRVIYHGYSSVPEYKQASMPPAFSQQHPLQVIFIGSFGLSYDLETIVEAANILQSQNEQRIKITLVGSGQQFNAIKAKAYQLKNLKLCGWLSQEQILEQASQAQVGLLLMKGGVTRFTIPNKLGEYLSLGLAIINSIPGEVQQLVDSSGSGNTIMPRDARSLAGALLELVEKPFLLEQRMEKSRRLFTEQFCAAKVYQKYIHLLHEILNQRTYRQQRA